MAKYTLMLLALSLLFIPFVSAQGVGISPSRLEIEIYRGEQARTQLLIINPSDHVIEYQTKVDDYKEWFTIFQQKGKIEPNQTQVIDIFVNTSDETSNGEYNTFITISIDNPNKQGVSFNTGISIKTKVKITGKQVINLAVEKIGVEDAEQGNFVSFKTIVHNNGNVKLKPLFNFLIEKNNISVDEFNFESDYILPNSRQKILINRSTEHMYIGTHLAKLQVSLDKPIKYQELSFNILPFGSLSRKGSFEKMDLTLTEQILEISSIFKNTGKAPLNAKFQGKIYFNNKLLDIIESDSILIIPGEERTIKTNYKLPQAGEYELIGNILYDGKTSKVIEQKINMNDNSNITGVTISLSIVVFGILLFYRKDILNILA